MDILRLKKLSPQPAGPTTEEFLETVQLLAEDVGKLQAQIQQLNGHHLEILDRRIDDGTFLGADRRKKRD